MADPERVDGTQRKPDGEVAAGTLEQAASKANVGLVNYMNATASGPCTPDNPAQSSAGGLPAATTDEGSAPSA